MAINIECIEPDYSKFDVTSTTWDFVTNRQTMNSQKQRLCDLSASIAQVVAAVFTGVLLYIGVVLRRRIVSRARKIEGAEDGVNEPLRTSRHQSTEASNVENCIGTLKINDSNIGLWQRNHGSQRKRSLSDPS